jgi:hypothetical protein
MSVQHYSIRKINIMPLAKFGFALGGVALFPPSLVCAWGSTQLLDILRNWLNTWQSTSQIELGLLELPGLDFIALLGLTETQALLMRLSDQPLLVAILIILSMVIGGGLVVGLSILLVGWGYNLLAFLTGGLELELQTR